MPPGVCTIRRKLPPNAAAKLGQPAGQAAVRQRAVLRTIMAIDARGVVARRKFRASRRGRRIVFAAAARRLLVLARLGRLQQGETKFPIGGGNLLSLRRQRRNPAIGRIDNQRRARAGVLHGHEHRVVGAGDVDARSRAPHALSRPSSADRCSIQFCPLRLGEKFLVRILGGALQGRVGFVGPNALQVGFAPGRFQRWGRRRGGSRRSLSRRPRDGHRNDGADSGRGNGDRYHRA